MSLKKHKQTHRRNDFIRGWYIDHKICDDLIEYFNTSPSQVAGMITGGVQEEKKKSTDVVLADENLKIKYTLELQKVFNEYIKEYPMVDFYSPWGILESINIQRYHPKEGFYAWHTERTLPNCKESDRHIVFMTYLNDVNDGGETEFYHQNLKVKAEKGLTVIWPSDWTFTHRGCTSNSETKYIITGWTSYYNKDKLGNYT